jgi:hypothetical protein
MAINLCKIIGSVCKVIEVSRGGGDKKKLPSFPF